MTITDYPSSERAQEELSLFGYFLRCFKKYATFKDRARRKEYWGFVLFMSLSSVPPLFLSFISLLCRPLSEDLLLFWAFTSICFFYALQLTFIFPYLAVLVRRLHDRNISGWGVLIAFIPIVGGIYMLVITCTEGTAGENRFGVNPKTSLKNL
jgi:uncharacterized membrane protein YhaH (DUF805 family)